MSILGGPRAPPITDEPITNSKATTDIESIIVIITIIWISYKSETKIKINTNDKQNIKWLEDTIPPQQHSRPREDCTKSNTRLKRSTMRELAWGSWPRMGLWWRARRSYPVVYWLLVRYGTVRDVMKCDLMTYYVIWCDVTLLCYIRTNSKKKWQGWAGGGGIFTEEVVRSIRDNYPSRIKDLISQSSCWKWSQFTFQHFYKIPSLEVDDYLADEYIIICKVYTTVNSSTFEGIIKISGSTTKIWRPTSPRPDAGPK